MPKCLKFIKDSPVKVAIVTGACVGTSTAAFGLPWDIDMADGQSTKAYADEMAAPPAGTVAQPHPLTPRGPGFAPDGSVVPNVERGSPEGELLTNPYADNLAMGEEMYATYCTPCHGDGQVLGTVAEHGFPAVAMLAGPAGRSKDRTDGWLYLTVRNGGGLMPSYGWAMSDQEMWSVVSYLRTLPDSQYVPPSPTPACQ